MQIKMKCKVTFTKANATFLFKINFKGIFFHMLQYKWLFSKRETEVSKHCYLSVFKLATCYINFPSIWIHLLLQRDEKKFWVQWLGTGNEITLAFKGHFTVSDEAQSHVSFILARTKTFFSFQTKKSLWFLKLHLHCLSLLNSTSSLRL